MIPQRYKLAEQRRQQILDYLTAGEGKAKTYGQISKDMPGLASVLSNTLHTMVELGEIGCEPGKRGHTKFWALSNTTVSAETRFAVTQSQPNSGRHKFAKANEVSRRRVARDGVTIHRSGDSAIPNQGGQGCVRSYGRRVNQDTM